MSGGTFDYLDQRLGDLADELRYPQERIRGFDDADEVWELPMAREAMARLLVVARDLMHDLDWHFAGDAGIDDERAWLVRAHERLEEVLTAFMDV